VDYKAVLGHVFSPTAYAGRLSRLAVKLDRSDRRRDLPDGDMRKRLGGIVSIPCGPRVAPVRVAKRSSMLCAIVAVARKLAGILHRMWISETDFKVGFGAKVTQRLRLKPAR
jgi:hypothetical protein